MLHLQLFELLLKLNVVFVHCFTGTDLLRKPVLQLGCIAADDLLDRHLALDLVHLLFNLRGDELFRASVDVVAAEVAKADVFVVRLDLLPKAFGVLLKMLLNHRGVIICILSLRGLHLRKARFELEKFQGLLGDHSVVWEANSLRDRLEVDLHTLAGSGVSLFSYLPLVFYNLDH